MVTSKRKELVVTLFVLMMLVRADRPGYVKASAGASNKHATFVEVGAHGTGVRLQDGGEATKATDSIEAATKDGSKSNLEPIPPEMRKTIVSVSLAESGAKQSKDESKANREPIPSEMRDTIAVSLAETGVKVAANKSQPQAGVSPGVAPVPASSPAGSRANASSSPSETDVVVKAGDGARPNSNSMALETPIANVSSSLSETQVQVVANSGADAGVAGNLSALGANASANAIANASVSLVQTLNASAGLVVASAMGKLNTELGEKCAFSDDDRENKAAFPAKDQGIRALQDCIAKLEQYQTAARSDQQTSTEENKKYKTAFIDALHRVTQVVKGDKNKFFEDTRENPNDRGKRGGVLILGNEFMADEERAEKDLLIRLANIREEVEKLNPEKLHTFTVRDHPGPTRYTGATLSEFDKLPQWVSASQKKRNNNNNNNNDNNINSNDNNTNEHNNNETETDDGLDVARLDEATPADDDDDDEHTKLADDDDDEHTKLADDDDESEHTKLEKTSSADGLDDGAKLGY